MKQKHVLLPIVIVYTVIVIYYSLVLEEELERVPLIGELFKIREGFYIHLLAYLVMAALWRGAGSKMTTSLIIAVTIGGVLEVAQSFMPSRYASFMDFFADSLGAFVGGMVIPIIGKKILA